MCCVVVVCILHLIKFVLAKENENIAECDICYHSAVAASAKERKLSVRIVNENFAEGGSKRVKCEKETLKEAQDRTGMFECPKKKEGSPNMISFNTELFSKRRS